MGNLYALKEQIMTWGITAIYRKISKQKKYSGDHINRTIAARALHFKEAMQ